MRIYVTAKPGAKAEKIETIDKLHYNVFVKEHAQKGKANETVIKALAKHFNVPKSFVIIDSGHMAKTKVITIVKD